MSKNKNETSIIIPLLIGIILGVLWFRGDSCTSNAKAECITYTTVKGDTLGKLAKKFYGDRQYWRDIKWQNNLKRNTLPIELELQIYIPDSKDWKLACRNILQQRINKKKISEDKHLYIMYSTIRGLEEASNIIYPPLNSREKIEFCRFTIVTAEQESMYQFAIGGAGEVGPYQFKLNTVRMTFRSHGEYKDTYLTDKTIVKMLLGYDAATMVFVLHYYDLLKKCKGSRWCAWKRYNNGSEASAYASKAMKRYWEIRQLQPEICKP